MRTRSSSSPHLFSSAQPREGRLTPRPLAFPIVGIGASAGGLDAFTRLLKHLPHDTGMAFVLVQHLSRDRASLLTGLLSKVTSMTVTEVKQGTVVRPNGVYVIPPNASMVISRRVLYLHRRLPNPAAAWPIDDLFHSLAKDLGRQAIGVILSGNASDGAIGLKAIKEAGGITFAQSEDTAQCMEMPHNAIAAGGVDKILRPAEIARELARIAQHAYMARVHKKEDLETPFARVELEKIFELLQKTPSMDYRHYRQTTIQRRLARRMVLGKIDRLPVYLKRLQRDSAEALALSNDMLIHTTAFFRDPKTFQMLERHVFPRLISRRPKDQPIRMWVPGCSTGQEVYSLAIAMTEFQARRHLHIPVRIMASDVNNVSIQKARRGNYAPNEMSGLSPQRAQQFFSKVDGGYQIAAPIRELCIFAKHDMLHDPPFSNMDLISCRNVLIYLEPIWQKQALSYFHYALRKDGILLLGPAEVASTLFRPLSTVDHKHRIHIKNPYLASRTSIWTYPRRTAQWHQGLPASSEKGRVPHVSDDVEKLLHSFKAAIKRPSRKAAWKKEMIETVAHFQEILEDRERTTEENQSTNEELQSTNEELETAKEELQSSNEELMTLSEEVQTRNGELILLNDDLTNVLTSVQIPLLMIGHDKRLRRATVATKSFGIYPSDIGKPIAECMNQLPVPDIENLLENIPRMIAPIEREVQDAHKNWYLLQIYPYLTLANQVSGLVFTFLDIDARKRSEARLQESRDFALAIVETVREPLVVLKEDLRVKMANRSFYDRFKLTGEEVSGRLFGELAHGLWDHPELHVLLRSIFTTKVPLVDFCVERDAVGGGHFSFILNARLMGRPAVEPEIIVSVQDVTKSKKLQELLMRSGKMSAVGKLAAGIAQELNNPLAAILGFVQSELRQSESPSPDLAGTLRSIERETVRCTRLVKDFLAFVRPREIGKILQSPETLLHRALRLIGAQAKIKQVNIIQQIEPKLPPIRIDSDQFSQIVVSLCSNAIDAMPNGGTLVVSLARNQGMIELRVIDTGNGIPPELQNQIFDPFFTTKGFGKGTGLGLSLAHEIIKNHSGSIEVESEVGKGTTFLVRLPISPAETASIA